MEFSPHYETKRQMQMDVIQGVLHNGLWPRWNMNNPAYKKCMIDRYPGIRHHRSYASHRGQDIPNECINPKTPLYRVGEGEKIQDCKVTSTKNWYTCDEIIDAPNQSMSHGQSTIGSFCKTKSERQALSSLQKLGPVSLPPSPDLQPTGNGESWHFHNMEDCVQSHTCEVCTPTLEAVEVSKSILDNADNVHLVQDPDQEDKYEFDPHTYPIPNTLVADLPYRYRSVTPRDLKLNGWDSRSDAWFLLNNH